MLTQPKQHCPDCLIVGAGFTGLSAALDLVRNGLSVTVLEKDKGVGGLAGGFDVDGFELERFYHHWFVSDCHVTGIVEEIGKQDSVIIRPTRTGMYYAGSFFRLSTPLDLLRFNALPFADRIRLGIGVLRARGVRDWMSLEDMTAAEWLLKLFGRRVYEVVWEPLLVGKFGSYAREISAVWFWKKLVLRGGSREKSGGEALAYYRGGFAALARDIAGEIKQSGGEIRTGEAVLSMQRGEKRIVEVLSDVAAYRPKTVLITTPLPIAAELLEELAPAAYIAQLRRVRYLANVCLVLKMSRSLSDTYWMNVNDPGFPFVGIIEHTNFEPSATYGNNHIIYLSKYLLDSDPLYRMDADELLAFALPYLKKMFPALDPTWVTGHYLWRADHAQPIVERNYSKLLPAMKTPLDNVFLCTMAQVYPEDRGTNYAIREGRAAAKHISAMLRGDTHIYCAASVELDALSDA